MQPGFAATAVLALCALGLGPAHANHKVSTARPQQPNIILILADDLGPDMVGAYESILLDERRVLEPGCADDPDCRPDPPCTPTLDALAARGMLFTRCWSNPFCSPTRAQIMTGQHSFRNGIGRLTTAQTLRFTTPPLAWRLGDAGYVSAALGKWHLQEASLDYDWNQVTRREYLAAAENERCPGRAEYVGGGFDYRLGSAANLQQIFTQAEDGGTYTEWEKNFNGIPMMGYCRYATLDTIDDALAMLDPAVPLRCAVPGRLPCLGPQSPPLCDDFDLVATGAPWFLYLALNAPHSPFHRPNPDFCPSENDPECYVCDDPLQPDFNQDQLIRHMTEVMDAQLARLLAVVDLSTTYVIFIGDNGTATEAIAPQARYRPDLVDPCAASRGKGSLYEGGLRVPLIIAGPGIAPGSRCDQLVSTVDLLATLCELAGADGTADDSVSFASYLSDPDAPPVRANLLAERFNGNFDAVCESFPPQQRYTRALRNDRYKLIRTQTAPRADCPGVDQVELYDLTLDPFEEHNLLRNPESLSDPQVAPPATSRDYCALRCAMIRTGVDQSAADDLCDCCIGLDELAGVLAQFGCRPVDSACTTCSADIDADCDVDMDDLMFVLERFGRCD